MQPKDMLWNSPGLQPRQPTPGEPVWSLRKEQETLLCELRDHGPEFGVEVQLTRAGAFLSGRRFDNRAAAVQYAELLRGDFERLGWTESPAVSGPSLG